MMKRGFTLIELVVVVGIIALISTMALANFPSFRGRLSLDREVGKLALTLRKAQQYSSGVKRFEGIITATDIAACDGSYAAQYPAYSVTVDVGAPTAYVVFADPDCDKISDTHEDDLIEMNQLENGVQVLDICINVDSPTPTCGLATLDIWYMRPNPTPLLTVDAMPSSDEQNAKIIVGLDDGSRKSIVIRKTGQISIQNE